MLSPDRYHLPSTTVAWILKYLKETFELSNEQLARRLEREVQDLNEIEAGSRKLPIAELDRWANIFGISMPNLMGEATKYSAPEVWEKHIRSVSGRETPKVLEAREKLYAIQYLTEQLLTDATKDLFLLLSKGLIEEKCQILLESACNFKAALGELVYLLAHACLDDGTELVREPPEPGFSLEREEILLQNDELLDGLGIDDHDREKKHDEILGFFAWLELAEELVTRIKDGGSDLLPNLKKAISGPNNEYFAAEVVLSLVKSLMSKNGLVS